MQSDSKVSLNVYFARHCCIFLKLVHKFRCKLNQFMKLTECYKAVCVHVVLDIAMFLLGLDTFFPPCSATGSSAGSQRNVQQLFEKSAAGTKLSFCAVMYLILCV